MFIVFQIKTEKTPEGFARYFTEMLLTSDQIIEHFFLKNNVQMQFKYTPGDSTNTLSSVLTFVLIIENVDGISDTATTPETVTSCLCDTKFLFMEMVSLFKKEFRIAFLLLIVSYQNSSEWGRHIIKISG